MDKKYFDYLSKCRSALNDLALKTYKEADSASLLSYNSASLLYDSAMCYAFGVSLVDEIVEVLKNL